VALARQASPLTFTGAGGITTVQLGEQATAVGASAIAIGVRAITTDADQIAIGEDATTAAGGGAIAIGRSASTASAGSVALGDDATASALNAIALGKGTVASHNRAAALQSGALADRAGVVIANDGGVATLKHSQTWERASSYKLSANTTPVPEQMPIADGSLAHITGIIIARRLNLAATKVYKWEVYAEKIAGVCRLIGTPTITTPVAEAGTELMTLTITVVTNNPQLNIGGTTAGEVTMGIHWRTEEIRAPYV
jgi:hypothetical protein